MSWSPSASRARFLAHCRGVNPRSILSPRLALALVASCAGAVALSGWLLWSERGFDLRSTLIRTRTRIGRSGLARWCWAPVALQSEQVPHYTDCNEMQLLLSGPSALGQTTADRRSAVLGLAAAGARRDRKSARLNS